MNRLAKTSFGMDLQRFAKKAGTNIETVMRGITIELFSSVILDTPVDTGRARGNWQTTVNRDVDGEVSRLDPTGFASIAEANAANFKLGDIVYLTNNLPYIERLEFDAWSKQAPDGMVRKNMARLRAIIADAAREVRV